MIFRKVLPSNQQTIRDCWSICEYLIEYSIQFDSLLQLHSCGKAVVAVQYRTVDYSQKILLCSLAVPKRKIFFPSMSLILKPLWRLTCRSSPVLLNDKASQHSRCGCPQRPEVWLHPIIRQVLWRYRSTLYRVHWVT